MKAKCSACLSYNSCLVIFKVQCFFILCFVVVLQYYSFALDLDFTEQCSSSSLFLKLLFYRSVIRIMIFPF